MDRGEFLILNESELETVFVQKEILHQINSTDWAPDGSQHRQKCDKVFVNAPNSKCSTCDSSDQRQYVFRYFFEQNGESKCEGIQRVVVGCPLGQDELPTANNPIQGIALLGLHLRFLHTWPK